ncbi:MAG: ParB N-terminal domain-containing protein, partial [Acidobacteriota bacterium]
MTQPPQPTAAVRPDTDDPDTPDINDERTPAPARTPGRGSRAGRSREGLPSSYRMRHAAHYVEQLMGDAPLQTVRQIALDHIDHPEPSEALSGGIDAADAVRSGVADLAASIRRVGVLQPLLVVQMPESRFQLLAGGKRWLAAQAAGLTTLPCLIVHADDARAAELRMQAAVRATAAQVVRGSESTETGVSPDTIQETEAAMTQAVAPGPESNLVAQSTLYGAVMADLARVEQRRASTVAVARAFLTDTAAP